MEKAGIAKQKAIREMAIAIVKGEYTLSNSAPKVWAPSEQFAGMVLWAELAEDGLLLRRCVRLSRFRRELNKYMRMCQGNPLLDIVVIRNNQPIGVVVCAEGEL